LHYLAKLDLDIQCNGICDELNHPTRNRKVWHIDMTNIKPCSPISPPVEKMM
jgi:hypothetical protein